MLSSVPSWRQGAPWGSCEGRSHPLHPCAMVWHVTDTNTRLMNHLFRFILGGSWRIHFSSLFLLSFGFSEKHRLFRYLITTLNVSRAQMGWANQDGSVSVSMVLFTRLRTAFRFPQMSPSDLSLAQDPVQAPVSHCHIWSACVLGP